ncbi:MAG: AAA family ATPase [Bacteroidales bacterium]|nr:AAA family ATPase [Bacteroidales bacterium]
MIIIRGASGSGKSSVAHLLAEQLENCVVLCPDIFYHEILKNVSQNHKFKKAVYDSLFLLASKYLVECGYNVVIEGILSSIYSLGFYDKFFRLSKENGFDFKQLVLDSSLNVTIERNRHRKHISEEQQKQWQYSLSKSIRDKHEKIIDVDKLSIQETYLEVLSVISPCLP